MNDKIPAISIIVPLYNAEKYIAQCLGSILNQTFQNFEVIVVDDCSTDNSVAIVESIAPKFDGRLHLVKRNKNSGGAAIPRNIGIKYSKGKYITFMDNDDILLKDSLEIFYSIAEKTQADVIHTEKWLEPQDKNSEINQNSKFLINTFERGGFVDEITIETENLENRINSYCQQHFFWHVWGKLFRRDFIIENNIEFPEIIIIDDMMFSFFCLCLAKRYVRIPNITNIYRVRDNSFLHKTKKIEERFRRYIKIILSGTRELEKFMKNIDFFIQNPQFLYMVMNFFIQSHIKWESDAYLKFPDFKFDSIIREEFFVDIKDSINLNTYIFSIVNNYYIKIMQMNKQNYQLQKQILMLQEEIKKIKSKK